MPLSSFRYLPYCIATLFSVFILSCSLNKTPDKSNNTTVTKKPADTSEQEDFDLFFKKFQSDSLFQLSRVSFPLKAEAKSDDGDSTRMVKKEEWIYTTIVSGKVDKGIIHKKKLSANEYLIQCQVNDTGIELDYHFINKKGKWQLAYVEDYSD